MSEVNDHGHMCTEQILLWELCFSSHVKQWPKIGGKECTKLTKDALMHYCTTLFFRCILISWFAHVENLLHFNFVDLPVNFIKQFVSCFFWSLQQCHYRNSASIIVYIT